jgi:hypothetical protein
MMKNEATTKMQQQAQGSKGILSYNLETKVLNSPLMHEGAPMYTLRNPATALHQPINFVIPTD